VVLIIAPGQAQAASPLLEFAAPTSAFPISFAATGGEVTAALAGFDSVVQCTGSHGDGQILGPRSALSSYVFTGCKAHEGGEDGQKCETEGAAPEEITSDMIVAELVFIDQAKHEVGMLLNPGGGVYMTFKCGGQSVKAIGSFLSPVGPLNVGTTSFTASLSRLGATQIPSEYENANGAKLQAIPMGEREGHPAATTGVQLSFAIQTSTPLEIKAITAAEVEAREREDKQRQDDEAAAAKKRQEEEANAKKRHDEEEAAAKKRQEEEANAKKPPTRAQQLSKALKRCRSFSSKDKRTGCESRAKQKYGSKKGHQKGKA
jgi:hypothetical protein